MTDATDATLQHNDVNSNTAVSLNNVTIKYAWKNIVKQDPIPGKGDISEVDYNGFENPIIILTGWIDTDDTSSNLINHSLLLDFAQANNSSNTTKLTITCVGEDTTATYLKGRPSTGYSVGGTYRDFLLVQVKNFSFNFGVPKSKEGRIWGYTIEFTETP